jgi:hypothetical protein
MSAYRHFASEEEQVSGGAMTGTALTPADRAVRLASYRSFAGQGRPPSAGQIAVGTGLAEADVRTAMRNLHAAHAIVLTPAGDAVRMAHLFSAAPMGFVVGADGTGPAGYAGDRTWWGGCAWCSFGIGCRGAAAARGSRPRRRPLAPAVRPAR